MSGEEPRKWNAEDVARALIAANQRLGVAADAHDNAQRQVSSATNRLDAARKRVAYLERALFLVSTGAEASLVGESNVCYGATFLCSFRDSVLRDRVSARWVEAVTEAEAAEAYCDETEGFVICGCKVEVKNLQTEKFVVIELDRHSTDKWKARARI